MNQIKITRRRLLAAAGVASSARPGDSQTRWDDALDGVTQGASLRQVIWARNFCGVRLVAIGLTGWRTIVQQLGGIEWCDMFIADSSEAGGGLQIQGRPRGFDEMGPFGAVTLIAGDAIGLCGSPIACAVAEAAARHGHLTIVLAAAPPNAFWMMDGARYQTWLRQLTATADCVVIDPAVNIMENAILRASALAHAALPFIHELIPENIASGLPRLARIFGRAGIGDYKEFSVNPFTRDCAFADWVLADLYGDQPTPARRIFIQLTGYAPVDVEAAGRLESLIRDHIPSVEVCESSLVQLQPPGGLDDPYLTVAIIRAGVQLL